MVHSQERGIIGRVYEDELPVIYKLTDELPAGSVRAALPWLAVVSWKYDGDSNNGMPADAVNAGMIQLEQAIEESAMLSAGSARHAYSRTGNQLKEWVYYTADRDEFIAGFNEALRGQPKYPVDIVFYHDPSWDDFQKLLKRF